MHNSERNRLIREEHAQFILHRSRIYRTENYVRHDARQVEKQTPELALLAKQELHRRRKRAKHIPAKLLGEYAWEILLELFCKYADCKNASIKTATIMSGASPTTALRVVKRLQDAGLVERRRSDSDYRVVLLRLTSEGITAVSQALKDFE